MDISNAGVRTLLCCGFFASLELCLLTDEWRRALVGTNVPSFSLTPPSSSSLFTFHLAFLAVTVRWRPGDRRRERETGPKIHFGGNAPLFRACFEFAPLHLKST